MSYPSLQLMNWPNTDRQAWERAIGKSRLFDPAGQASRWAAATKATNIRHYGRWLAFHLNNAPGLAEVSPAERLGHLEVEAYIAYLERELASVTVASSIAGLASMMRVLEPRHEWAWLKDASNLLNRNARPVRDKRARIRPVKYLFETALAELKVAANSGLHSQGNQIRFRNALMLGLFTACPVRLKNFSNLRVGTSLVKLPSGWRVQFPPEDVKNKQRIDLAVPRRLASFLEQYLTEVLPALTAGRCNTIWSNAFGGQMTGHAIYLLITKYTKRTVGTPIGPHLFRDCAATSMSTFSIQMALAAGDLLGHSNFSTTEKYYIHAAQLESARKINCLLDD